MSPNYAPRPSGRRRLLHWFLIISAAATLVVAVKLVGIFFVSAEARDLQVAICEAAEGKPDTHLQFSIGPGILSIGRLAVLMIDDVPPEARQALSAIDRASVGIYQLAQRISPENRGRMLAAADGRLAAKGWERIVTVVDDRDLVLIYMPRDWDDADDLEVCIAVCDGDELVVVSAQARSRPLMKWVQKHLPKPAMI